MADTRYDTPEPFKVDIPERALIDLDERLRRWRPPVAIADGGSWASGTDPAFLAELVDYWRHGYDWQRCQEAINQWPNYLVDIGPQRLHFIREPGTEVEDAPRPLPLIVTHGWPGSIVEFLHLIDVLAHPEEHGGDPLDAFDVIVPSLPGYGFSGPPIREDGTTGPIGPRAIAGLWHRLVSEKLNYDRPYGIQGGDWGAVVSSWLAFDHPQKDDSGVLGVHLNMMGLRPGLDLETATLSADEQAWLAKMGNALDDKTAYQRIHATRPQTRFARRPRVVDRREVPGVERLRRRSAEAFLDGHAARQHHGLLADRHRRHRNLALSWRGRAEAARAARRCEGGDADRLRGLPGRHRARAAEGMDRARLQPSPSHDHAERRPLRGARGT
jgi:pimeloyl-ACP methyl ester carboxylesterase